MKTLTTWQWRGYEQLREKEKGNYGQALDKGKILEAENPFQSVSVVRAL